MKRSLGDLNRVILKISADRDRKQVNSPNDLVDTIAIESAELQEYQGGII